MLSIQAKIPKKIKRGGTLQPVLPLVPEKLPTAEEDKSKFVTFELKTQVGQADTATKYKKVVRKFDEGTAQQWIDVLHDLKEIWKQNSIQEGSDQAATIRVIVKGESITAFEAALEDARLDENGVEQPMTEDHVQQALDAVSATVFPHRALEIQKLWMNRRMYKPTELSTRQTAAAINRLNNSLPLFPGGSDDSKFTDVQVVELLEWSLPPTWRAKFDLDGYIPTLGTKSRLIEACEAIERNEVVADNNDKKKGKQKQAEKGKNENSGSGHKKGDGKHKTYFCTEHGTNSTHSTSDCWTIKNRAARSDGSGGNKTTPPARSFSNKAFRKEVNLLSRSSSKRKVLESYATAIQREQTKLAKKANKRKKSAQNSEGESDDDMSVEVIESPVKIRRSNKSPKTLTGVLKYRTTSTDTVTTPTTVNGPAASAKRIAKMREQLKLAKRNANSSTTVDTTLEEEAYQRRVKWLEDHGEPLTNEPSDGPTDSSNDDDESADEQTKD